MMKYIALSLILLVVFAIQVSAQSLPVNGKIPDDLLITLKTQGAWGGTYSEMTINANGEFSYKLSGGNMPAVSLADILGIKRKDVKLPAYLKPKLSVEKLRSLIAEFEKIQFFKFGKDFPQEDDGEHWSVSDAGSEVISIRLNGQIKEVSNYLGDSLKRTRLLRDLAERIRGAGVWNYENNEIPKNFEVWYRITDGDKIQKDLKINAKGKITETIYSSRFYPKAGKELPILVKSRKVGKLSKQQLRELIGEFEKAVFSTFKYSSLSKYDGCTNASDSIAEKRTHINVQINQNSQMYASLYENCNPKPETGAAKFEYIKGVIERLLLESVKSKK